MIKKAIYAFLILPFLLAGTAAGQSNGKSNVAKFFTISGKVSEDGRSVTEKNGKPWMVTNQATLAGHENRQVKVKCQISSGNHQIRVLSLKEAAPQAKYPVNRGDSAFRR